LDALDVGVTVDVRDDATVEPKDPNIEKTGSARFIGRLIAALQFCGGIAVCIHNALNRVTASRTGKNLELVTKIVIGMRATSRQVRPLAAMRTAWSIDCAKA
jgi:hypothetical protein